MARLLLVLVSLSALLALGGGPVPGPSGPLPFRLPERPANAASPPISLQQAFGATEPVHFRTAAQLAAGARGTNAAGLASLRLSGSATFGPAAWEVMRAQMGPQVLVVNLRQESHALLNDAPIAWYASDDWGEVGSTREEALAVERSRQDALRAAGEVMVIPQADLKAGSSAGITVPIRSVRTEQELVEGTGARWERLTVTDHLRPSDADVERFLALWWSLEPGTWVHVHCAGGDGRTTTFMAMVDMLQNAHQVPFEAILARQAAAGPLYRLDDVHTGTSKEPYYQDRLAFLRAFHGYAAARHAGHTGSWTAWASGAR